MMVAGRTIYVQLARKNAMTGVIISRRSALQERKIQAPAPPSPDESEVDEHNEDNDSTGYAANEQRLDFSSSSDVNDRLSNAVNDTQVEDRGYTNTVVKNATSNREAQEEDILNFFLVLLGTERKFQVAMPEMEAEELTIREIKENFAGTLQAQVEDIVISIGGEVLRNDIKGHEFGLADGTELEVSLPKEEETKSSKIPSEEDTINNGNSYANEKDTIGNSQFQASPEPRSSAPPPPIEKDDSKVFSSPTYNHNSYDSSNGIASTTYGMKRPSFIPPTPPAYKSDNLTENRQHLGQLHTGKINLEVVDKGDVEVFSITSDKNQRVELGIRQFCKLNDLEFESIGPTIMQHLKTITKVEEVVNNTPETKYNNPVSPQVRKELSLALLNNQQLKQKCNALESQVKLLETTAKEKQVLEGKCKSI